MRARLLRWTLHLFALLPLPLAHALGAVLGWLFHIVPNSVRTVVRKNVQLCFPEQGPDWQRRLARRSLIETGKTFAEVGALWLWPGRRVLALVREVRGADIVETAERRGHGVIFLTPHLGAWELTSHYLAVGRPLTALYRPPRMQEIEALVHRCRERLGARLVPTTAGGVRALYRALAQGEAVGILPDQDPGRGQGIFAPFFGVPANTMVLVSRLAHKTGAPVIFICAERLRHGRGFRIHFRAAPVAVGDADAAIATAALNAGVEACVRDLPTQYQWSYKRFKTRPADAPNLY